LLRRVITAEQNVVYTPNDPKIVADDLLIGASAIAGELRAIGFPNCEESEVYYIAKAKKLPINKWGKFLIASRSALRRAAHALTA
jgi:hypothetical protein